MKRLLIVLAALTVALTALYFSWYGYLFNGVYATYLQGRTTSDPFDETLFDVDSVSASPNPVAWPVGLREDLAPSEATAALLASSQTGAVLVFESDTLRHEAYFDDFQATSRVNSFSMAKSIVTMLV